MDLAMSLYNMRYEYVQYFTEWTKSWKGIGTFKYQNT